MIKNAIVPKEIEAKWFAKTLNKWYLINKRELPWRKTNDPYTLWVSEVILQQTRVEYGKLYFKTFLEAFPKVEILAAASEQDVLQIWQGLGYYSRARNMHKAAKIVVNDLDGHFPESFQALKALPGIGLYTAAAVASFSSGEAHPAIDGNVIRFFSRYFGITEPKYSSEATKNISDIGYALIADADAASFNQAIMEFGALQCTPKKPDCRTCPFNSSCVAYKKGLVADIPAKKQMPKPINRYLNYVLIHYIYRGSKMTLINKRDSNDIWAHLFEFPLIESLSSLEDGQIASTVFADFELNPDLNSIIGISQTIKHRLSHQLLHIRFIHIDCLAMPNFKDSLKYKSVNFQDIRLYPFPVVISKYLEKMAF